MDLIIPLWKPEGISSFKALYSIKNVLKGVKVGHAGTLDPFAEGLLLACTGKKTKSINKLMDLKKEYVCRIKLGSETDTLDKTGEIIKEAKIEMFDKCDIDLALSSFIGEISQVPPTYSALKVSGARAYDLARKGIQFSLMPRKVNIFSIELLEYDKKFINIKVICSKGTYIRSLARDISYKLKNLGHLDKLQRTKVGEYNKDRSVSLNGVERWISINQ